MAISSGRPGVLFGKIAFERGLVNEEQLSQAIEKQQTVMQHRKIGEILVRFGYISESHIAEILAEQLGLELAGEMDNIPSVLTRFINSGIAILFRIVPIRLEGGILTIATADPQNSSNIDNIIRLFCLDADKVKWAVATPNQIRSALERYYDYQEPLIENDTIDQLPFYETPFPQDSDFIPLSAMQKLQEEVKDLREQLKQVDDLKERLENMEEWLERKGYRRP